MATALDRYVAKTDLQYKFRNDLAGAPDPVDNFPYTHSISMTNGEGANQAEVPYRTLGAALAGGATAAIDLAGVLTGSFGSTLAYNRIKHLLLVNKSTTAAVLRLESDTTNGHLGIFKAKGDGIQIPPGGRFEWGGPSAAGAPVTPATGDLLNIVNEDGALAAAYDLILCGCVT